jgi:hypothetical protein
MTPQEHFEYCDKKKRQQRAYRERLKNEKKKGTP